MRGVQSRLVFCSCKAAGNGVRVPPPCELRSPGRRSREIPVGISRTRSYCAALLLLPCEQSAASNAPSRTLNVQGGEKGVPTEKALIGGGMSWATASGGQRAIGPLHSHLAAAGWNGGFVWRRNESGYGLRRAKGHWPSALPSCCRRVEWGLCMAAE